MNRDRFNHNQKGRGHMKHRSLLIKAFAVVLMGSMAALSHPKDASAVKPTGSFCEPHFGCDIVSCSGQCNCGQYACIYDTGCCWAPGHCEFGALEVCLPET